MVAEGKQTFRTKYFGDKAFYKMIMAIALPYCYSKSSYFFVAMLDNVMVGKIEQTR